jgi:hypothetical protein
LCTSFPTVTRKLSVSLCVFRAASINIDTVFSIERYGGFEDQKFVRRLCG